MSAYAYCAQANEGQFGLYDLTEKLDKTCDAEVDQNTSWWSRIIDAIKKLIDRLTSFITSEYDASMLEEKGGLVYLIDDDDPFTGTMLGKYKNGGNKIVKEYKDGLAFGAWQEWYEDGKEKVSGTLLEGSGVIKYFDAKGNRVKQSSYENGHLKTIRKYNPSGQLLGVAGKFGIHLDTEYKVIQVLEDDSKRRCKHLVDDILSEPANFISTWTSAIEKNEFNSEHISFIYNYKNGNICAIFPLENGMLAGAHYLYLPDGSLLKFIRFKEGEVYGEFATYLEKKDECFIGDNTSGASGGHWKGTCNRIND
jgi:antitoxin component YwqK of YwqJK toxin-antitoxin module